MRLSQIIIHLNIYMYITSKLRVLPLNPSLAAFTEPELLLSEYWKYFSATSGYKANIESNNNIKKN